MLKLETTPELDEKLQKTVDAILKGKTDLDLAERQDLTDDILEAVCKVLGINQ